jgi:magnesium transporter
VIVDCAVYDADGRRSSGSAADALDAARACQGFAWIGLHEPTATELAEVAQRFDLHPLAVEDAANAHQRPKLERYGDSLLVVLKTAIYVDRDEVVDLGELLLFVGRDFVVTVRHGSSTALAEVRRRLEAQPEQLAWGPTAVLHAVADAAVDRYGDVLVDLDVDIDEIELQVFSGPAASHGERIFKLKREVIDFRRAVEPLVPVMAALAEGPPGIDERATPWFRDVTDHLRRVADHLSGLDALLDSALNANVAQVAMRQNEDMRKISAWVAIAAVPTMIAGIYGMNFEHMPELQSTLGYPLVLGLMGAACVGLFRAFRRRGWL